MPPPPRQSWASRNAPAGVLLFLGLAVSVGGAWGLYREGVKADAARFDVETEYIAGTIEQTMERYEERLGRLADYCAMHEEMPQRVWSFRRHTMTDFSGSMPCVIHAVYCPRVPAREFQAHLERGRDTWRGDYDFNPETPPGRDFALPVLRFWSRNGFEPMRPGTDMARIGPGHPSLAASQGIDSWISPEPLHLIRGDGTVVSGFWFVQTLFATNQEPILAAKQPDETEDQYVLRNRGYLAAKARGLLAAFISTDELIDTLFNDPATQRRIHVQLFAASEPSAAAAFSSRSQRPENPRHRRVIVQPWYQRRWCLELTSTPLFESESPRGRAWLVLGGGAGMTALATALVGITAQGRRRQEQMTAEVLEARDAAAAAEKERERLGHDLHDGAIQSLYALRLNLERAERQPGGQPAGFRQVLSAARSELDAVIAEIRRFILVDEPSEQSVDLAAALRAIIRRDVVEGGAPVELHCDPAAAAALSPSQAIQVANIAREALNNAWRHARATQIKMQLVPDRDFIRLEVADDGVGFDPREPMGQRIGLASMAARSRDLRAELEIDSRPGRGTRVVVRIPAVPEPPAPVNSI